MMDAGPIRRGLYGWGSKTGTGRATSQTPALHATSLALPLADLLVLRPIRDFLGLSSARAVLSGGSGIVGRIVHALFMRLAFPWAISTARPNSAFVSTHRRRGSDPATMGAIAAARSDHRAADGSVGRCERAASRALLRLFRLSQERSRDGGARHCRRGLLDRRRGAPRRARAADFSRSRQGHAQAQGRTDLSAAIHRKQSARLVYDPRRHRASATRAGLRDRAVNVDSEIAGRFAETQGLAYGTFTELSQLPEIRAEVARAIRDVKALVDRRRASPRSRRCRRNSTPTKRS